MNLIHFFLNPFWIPLEKTAKPSDLAVFSIEAVRLLDDSRRKPSSVVLRSDVRQPP